MNAALEAKYLRLEQSRNLLLDELEGLGDNLLNTYPAAGKWSINQIIAHLVLAEKQTVNYVEHKIARQAELHSATLSNSIKSFLLTLALKSGRKYKAPESVATVPAISSLPVLRSEWDQVRFKLEDVLSELPQDLSNKCLFRHPHIGPLTMQQTLTFLQDHFNHHLRQVHHIKRNLLK
ncbi:DinB family protein [Pontibacter sp. 172403-2]|uniref:DinB family protein n=1 Tax=Pontibacter rufus TaxID=2791028 RepID=UPI0018AFABF7|nr:DinB family protein [Pontibacter sp. 172403-2]MBF9254984.1 DinB family protein [Pontibacter sp. 172403-2]